MAERNEILTGVAKTIGGTLGAVVGSAEAMKDKVVSAVERAPSVGQVKRKVARVRRAASGGRSLARGTRKAAARSSRVARSRMKKSLGVRRRK